MTETGRILVIDDDAMTRLLTREVLERVGFQVVEADCGLTGVDLLSREAFDLVLLDLLMPDLDGFDCLRLIQQNPSHDTPVVIMTAVEDIHCVEQAYKLGATDFIDKPIQWLLLPYRVDYLLHSQRTKRLLLEGKRRLQESEERLRLSLAAARQGLWDLDVAKGLMVINAEYAEMIGYGEQAFHRMSLEHWFALIHPDDAPHVEACYQRYLQDQTDEYRIEFRQQGSVDDWKWLLMVGRVVETDAKGQPLRMLGTQTDITTRKRSEERLQLLAKVFESSGEGIVICDAAKRVLSINNAFTVITGYYEHEVVATSATFLDPEFYHDDDFIHMEYALRTQSHWRGEIWQRRKIGSVFAVGISISAISDNRNEISHYIGVFSDITERKAAEARIEYLAHHDPLTGLPNRALLQDRFEQAVAHAVRRKMHVALMFLDLDRFKYINDTLGHDIGDSLLKAIAERLKQCIRELDTVCRQGGDEFIVILNELPDKDTAEQVTLKILEHLHRPFKIDGITLSTSFSIGISLFPSDGGDFSELLNKADTAMYVAKSEGRNTYRFFSNAMLQASLERMHIENGLRGALEQQQFQLYFQPLHALDDNRIVGVEALLRWRSSDGQMMAPGRFIPVAEDNGLILPIGNWVLHQACLQNRRWHDDGFPLIISVNISAIQLKRGNLVDAVKTALADSGLEPSFLELELTESVLMEDTQAIIQVIRELKAIGVRFAIDDFGTGYSSLSYLKQFAVDKLKIDQSFVKELESGKIEDRAIVQAVVQIGNSLGLETLAEGVETLQQVEQLRALGCKTGQGTFWHMPMRLYEFESLLRY